MTAVLTTGAPRENWQVDGDEELLSHRPACLPLRFELESDGSLVVNSAGRLPEWAERAADTLAELLALPENWNGYGARAVEWQVVPVVLNFLADVFADGEPPFPDLVPTVDGGVQVEWHVGGFDLEVEVSPKTGVRAYFCDEAAGEEWEGSALSNLDLLGRAVTRLRDQ